MHNLGWGLEMTVVGMGVVFGLLLVLMGLLLAIGRLDAEPKPAVEAEATPALETTPEPVAAADLVPDEPASTSVEILTDDLTVDQAAAVALAVVIHAQVRRQQAAPAMRTHAPGSQIHTSRWVAVGRGAQNQSWNRR
ncbi:OadG family protein [Luteococcus peritonei]